MDVKRFDPPHPGPGTGTRGAAGPPARNLVACFGETMAQLSAVPPDTLASAESLALNVAGAESTVALYLAHLGHPVAWVSRLGADPFGSRIAGLLAGDGVLTQWVEHDAGRPTGVYFKDPAPGGTAVHYYRAGSAASAMSPAMLRDDLLESVAHVHISGITPALSDSCNRLTAELFRRRGEHGYTISFDVNHRPALWGGRGAAGELLAYARAADIVFVGLDEAEALWGTSSAAAVRVLVDSAAELVVKDGPVGATVFASGRVTFEAAHAVEVVEPVGAGDSFAAGYLHQWLSGGSHPAMLRSGHLFAAAVLRTTADFVPPADILDDRASLETFTVKRKNDSSCR